ncbi:cytochrome b/b6 domain-containing protein [Vreelandella stevensii]|uniref:cytochrome b/b6 domain-containing protein n=1 Tax=Vreelandella stevensii TaxID=502821 RepID=UPI0002F15D12|nr:cytochrome b/b6 domain-containing protein [Halomonas stevensii]
MQKETRRIAVWDVLIRLCHLALLVAVALAFYTTKTDGAPFLFPIEVHAQAGYVILGLVVFRVLWGLVGSRYARFSTFLYSPARTTDYVRALMKRREPRYASHNPLGGWMVVLLLLSLGFQALSGLFLSDDIFFQGPLNGWIERDLSRDLARLHALNSDLLLILIGVHVAGVALHGAKGEGLLAAMVTGVKRFARPPVDEAPAVHSAATQRLCAVGALLVAAGVSGWLWFA